MIAVFAVEYVYKDAPVSRLGPAQTLKAISPNTTASSHTSVIGVTMASRGDNLFSQLKEKSSAAHESTQGPGDARPTALQIIKDNNLEGKLTDKVIFITGCSSGIGIETTRALALTGARLFCSARDLEKGKAALSDILEPGRVELIKLDMNSLNSVRACADEFLSKSQKLNVLINNAGVMRTPEGRTTDGFETQLGTNHLAHFLLFNLLKPALLAGSSPVFQSRVVNVASTGHRYAEIHFDNINLENGIYDPGLAYGQSKLANIYMANEIETRYGSQGIHGLSLHPGGRSFLSYRHPSG